MVLHTVRPHMHLQWSKLKISFAYDHNGNKFSKRDLKKGDHWETTE